jgi:L-seryl-tRNA(Ser) seleniumtransferase
MIGGGTPPTATLPTYLLAISGPIGAEALVKKLRESHPPVIARIDEERVLLDLRTVAPEHDALLAEQVKAASASS